VFFVGGPQAGSQAGNSEAGGCTKAWFDGSFTQLSDIMGANGQPLIADADATLTEYDTNKKITRASGNFAGIEVGMVAYISDGGTDITTGRYKITTVAGDDSYIYVDGLVCSGNSAGDVTINIGGAFDTIENAIAQGKLDASTYGLEVYTNNKDETPDVSLVVNLNSSADVASSIIGFYEMPGDMDIGGDYYESPHEIHRNSGSISADKTVKWDGNGADWNLLFLGAGEESIQFRNIHFANVHGAYLVTGASGSDYHRFINCRFSLSQDCTYQVYLKNRWFFSGCYFNGAHATTASIGGSTTDWGPMFYGCVFDVNVRGGYGIRFGTVFAYCIFDGGGTGIETSNATNYFIGNVFYNQTSRCIHVYDSTGGVVLINNVFMPNESSDDAVLLTDGCIRESYNNLCWSVGGGTPDSMPPWGVVLTEDPKFFDPANGDFRFASDSPCLNRGYTPDDSFVNIGPWQRKSMLPVKY